MPALRSLSVGNYLIFYRPLADGIEIVRVLHGARDIDSLF
jgi:toxin ParE1/3/4